VISIETGIPVPKVNTSSNHSRGKKYPWLDMEVGDSFFVPDMLIQLISNSVTGASKRTGFKFTCRTVEGGVRVWRIG
jgi:hypothetical protein